MLLRLLLLFTLVPLVEWVLLIWLSRLTGLAWTILLVLATGVVGAFLARQQGWKTWRRIQQELARGETPGSALIDGLMILIAGALLITPGILTDLVGFALLVPRFRGGLKRKLWAWLKARSVIQVQSSRPHGAPPFGGSRGKTVIDAEFSRRPTDEDEPRREERE